MDRLTLNQNTSLKDISDFMARQDQNATVLAKKDGQGNTVLYTRENNPLTGIKGFFTSIKDKFLESRGEGKASFAQTEVQNFVKDLAKTSVEGLYDKADQLSGGHKAIGKLESIVEVSTQVLGLDKPTASMLTKITSNLDMLTSEISSVLDFNIGIKDDTPPLPPTQNKSLGGGLVRKDGMDRTVTTPDLEIGGKKFECDSLIGTGGGGVVYSYKAQDGTKLAVKITPDIFATVDKDEKNEGASRELANNTRVMGGNQNVTGFSQHVVMDNGLVALIGDIMPNGDLTKLGETLTNAHFLLEDITGTIPSGMIGDAERKLVGLTLLQDAASGLSGLNDAKGVSHGDMKSQNVMIDGNGVAKLIDLGESAKTDKIMPGNYKFPENAMYRAPETTLLLKEAKDRKTDVQTASTDSFKHMLGELRDAFGTEIDEENSATLMSFATDISKDLKAFVEVRSNSDLTVGKTFDSFGLGTVGFELLVGGRATQDVEDAKYSSGTEKNVEDWRQKGTDFIGTDGLTRRTSGDTAVDTLLNGMLKSDPNERLTAAQVRDDPVMSTPGVGSPEVRELIKALASGDPTAIDTARNAVREKFGDI